MKETLKITTTANKNKKEEYEKRESEKNSETNISHNKNNEQDISHEVETINTSNSQENIENNDIEREENVIIETKRYLQKEILLKVQQRNILVTIQEQITLKD